ncbi:TonB-dependent receptor plug domain-containing protein [Croceivirga thetidis]|uniref:TonB-dependent receptor plug domain-containing protein n=1 Tax=Croceivirga thetidis TaxID=2721623 RepID=A0ABX1GTR3_9FLAO|nr:TonB-dependent receptor plug domain-containing protein [Croceivirga thetidis]NKI32112.1 TonB-dependent receptor plug domain-containing protein [Croceivirga thetidis]
MKTISTFLALFLGLVTMNAQNVNPAQNKSKVVIRCGSSFNENTEPLYVVDGLVMSSKEIQKISPDDIVSTQFLKVPSKSFCGIRGQNGVVLIETNLQSRKKSVVPKCSVNVLPFKEYCIQNQNWTLQQDIFNALQSSVASLQLDNKSPLLKKPSLRIRGQEITTVILDGIRYDASVLNALNPEDVESIKIAPSVAAVNYYANASNIQ